MRKTKSSGRTNSARSRPCAATWSTLTSRAWSTRPIPARPAKFLPSPKLSLIFGPWSKTEFYVQGGFGFHSNDGRGTTQTVEPVSAENPYPNTPATRIPPLIPTKGAEIGVRTAGLSNLQSTAFALVSPQCFRTAAESATPEARLRQHSRATATVSNGRTTTRHLSTWLLISTLRLREPCFTTIDDGDAAPDSLGRQARARSGWVGDFIGYHAARLQTASRRVCAYATSARAI